MEPEDHRYVSRILPKKDVFTTRVSSDWNRPTRFNARLRKPYWDISDRNKAVSLPAPEGKRLALERKLQKHLSEVADSPENQKLRRLYRKLVVKRLKKSLKIDQRLNIQSEAESGILNCPPYRNDYIKCNFTGRVLCPVIYQDLEIEPPLIKVHNELREKVKRKFPDLELPDVKKYPVNYVYINETHIQVVNELARAHFWSGIDTSIALKYPEFSCVATYRRIVVGFGFIVPGNHLNEAYINFLLVRPKWRTCGIAKMILYHLIQSCKTWDITLHVSPSNPAVALYQQFGFKSQLLLRNFYEMYQRPDSKESVHALFMKLERSEIIK